MRSIRGSDVSGGFVPAISITVAMGLTLASLVLLIFFIHHVSASIQASRIVSVIAESTEDALQKIARGQSSASRARAPELPDAEDVHDARDETLVRIRANGYLQSLDLDGLARFAADHRVVIVLSVKPGDHLVEGMDVAWLRQKRGSTPIAADAIASLEKAFLLGDERTPTQDLRYQFQQLTDVVVRALSPGINDPFTAINGIDELAVGLAQLARLTPLVNDVVEGADLRVHVPPVTLDELLDETVGHIAIYAAGDRFVMAGLRRVLDIVSRSLSEDGAAAGETIARLRNDLLGRERAAGKNASA